MAEYVVCLGCGGVVTEAGQALPEDEARCDCVVEARPALLVCRSCGGSLTEGARACPYCHATIATTRCGHCSAWNVVDAEYCQKCGRGIDRSETTGGGAVGDCPRCATALIARSYAELDVFECDVCGGIFLDAATLERVLSERDRGTMRLALPKRKLRPEKTTAYLPCPVCKKLMNRSVFGRVSGVIVDTCKGHGVWFDAGELAEALTFVEQGGMSRTRERELEEIKEAERSLRATQSARAGQPPVAEARGWTFLTWLDELWRGL